MTVMLATSVYLSTDVLAARWRDRVRGRGEKEGKGGVDPSRRVT